MSTELDEVTMAVAAINKVESGLAALRETYGGVIFEVTTSAGMEVARAARRAIREPRFEVERIRKAAKAPILALGKKLDAEAARITRELTLIEAPIDEVITAEEARKEQRIAAELARTEEIQRRLDWMRDRPVKAAGKSSAEVLQMIDTLDGYLVDETVFEERLDDAKAVLDVSRAALRGLHVAALDAEAKEVQLALDRQEFARLKAEEAERQKIAREAQAKADADAQVKRDAEAKIQADARAAQDAIDKANRERNEMAMQEIQAIHHQLIIADTGRAPYCKGGDLQTLDWLIPQTEEWPITEEKFGVLRAAAQKTKESVLASLRQKRVDMVQRIEDEKAAEFDRQHLADQRAALAVEQEALRVSKLPPARKPKHSPGAEAIVDAVSSHFGVDGAVARRWLREVDWETVAA